MAANPPDSVPAVTRVCTRKMKLLYRIPSFSSTYRLYPRTGKSFQKTRLRCSEQATAGHRRTLPVLAVGAYELGYLIFGSSWEGAIGDLICRAIDTGEYRDHTMKSTKFAVFSLTPTRCGWNATPTNRQGGAQHTCVPRSLPSRALIRQTRQGHLALQELAAQT
eukprot:3356000-Rhodomonas_salina.1